MHRARSSFWFSAFLLLVGSSDKTGGLDSSSRSIASRCQRSTCGPGIVMPQLPPSEIAEWRGHPVTDLSDEYQHLLSMAGNCVNINMGDPREWWHLDEPSGANGDGIEDRLPRSFSENAVTRTFDRGLGMPYPGRFSPLERGRTRVRWHTEKCQYSDCQRIAGFVLSPRPLRSGNGSDVMPSSAASARSLSMFTMAMDMNDTVSPERSPQEQSHITDAHAKTFYFCAKHAPKRSVHYSQFCCYPQCSKVASYEIKTPDFASRDTNPPATSQLPHRQGDRPRRQQYRRSFSAGSARLVFCAEHAPAGVSDYRHMKCASPECSRQGIWVDTFKTGSESYCNKHRHDLMVLRTPRRRSGHSSAPAPAPMACGSMYSAHMHGNASTADCRVTCALTDDADAHLLPLAPLAQAPGSAQPLRGASQLATASLMLSRRRSSFKCMDPLGCERFASFGPPGGKPRFCALHRASQDTYLRKCCAVEGCNARPAYGDSSTLLTHCSVHRLSRHKRQAAHVCRAKDCNRHAVFGHAGRRLYCMQHRGPGHVDVVNRGCEVGGCRRRASYGAAKQAQGDRPHPYPRWCAEHADHSRSVDLRHARCRVEGCQKHPSFGPPRAEGSLPAERLYCSKHKTHDSVNLKVLAARRRGGKQHQDTQARGRGRARARASALDLSDTDSTPSLPPTHALSSGSERITLASLSETSYRTPLEALQSSSREGERDIASPPTASAIAAATTTGGQGADTRVAEGALASCGSFTNHTALTRWFRYCQHEATEHGLAVVCALPATEDTVLAFIDFLRHEGKIGTDTLSSYLTVINKLHSERGFDRPALGPRVRMAKKAFAAARLDSLNEAREGKARVKVVGKASVSLLKGDSSLSRDSLDNYLSGLDVAGRDDAVSLGQELERRLWTQSSQHVSMWIHYCTAVVPALGGPALQTVPADAAAIRDFISYIQHVESAPHIEKYLMAINALHTDLGYPNPAVAIAAGSASGKDEAYAPEAGLLSPQAKVPAPPCVPLSPLVLNAKEASHDQAHLLAGRCWKACASAMVAWLHYCREILPASGLAAIPAVPAAAGMLASYVAYLTRHDKVHPDKLPHYLGAVNMLHQSLGYPPPAAPSLLDMHKLTKNDTGASGAAPSPDAEAGDAAYSAAASGLRSLPCNGAVATDDALLEDASMCSARDEEEWGGRVLPCVVSWAVHASTGRCGVDTSTRGGLLHSQQTPVPPPMILP